MFQVWDYIMRLPRARFEIRILQKAPMAASVYGLRFGVWAVEFRGSFR